MPNDRSTPEPETAPQQETGGGCQQEPCSPSSKTPKDFADTGNPITAWAFYEVFERKHCGKGWLRAQMSQMEHDRDNLREILRRLIQAKDEKEAHGDTLVYRSLKKGLWGAARNTISPENAELRDRHLEQTPPKKENVQ